MAYQFQGSGRGIAGSQISTPVPVRVNANPGQAAPRTTSLTSGVAHMIAAWSQEKSAEMKRDKDQREILQGMSMAAQGMAIDEVAKQESWYNKIFGQTNLTDGARTYHAANAGNQILQDINDQMPNLAQLSPEEARELIHERIKFGSNTGDPGIDFQAQQQVLGKLPQILKNQAKMNYEWQQENMLAKQKEFVGSNVHVAGQTLQQMASDPDTDPKDIAALVQGLAEGMMPAPGQDQKAWSKNMSDMAVMQAAMAGRPRKITQPDGSVVEVPGNLYALEAIRASGVIDALNADDATKVMRAFETAEQTSRKRYADAYSDRLSTLYAKAGQPVEGVNAQMLKDEITALNRQYMKDTGSSIPLLDSDQVRAIMTRNIDAITRENERRADKEFQIRERQMAEAARRRDREMMEHAKAMAALQKQAFIAQNAGSAGRYIARGAMSAGDVQGVMNERIDAAPDFASRLSELSRWDVVHKGTKYDIQQGINALIDNPALGHRSPDTIAEQAQRFTAMDKALGSAKAQEYYGENYKLMKRLSETMQTVSSPAAAWEMVTNEISASFGKSTDADKKAAEIIKDNQSGWFMEAIGAGGVFSRDLKGTSKATLRKALAKEYEAAYQRTGDEETAKATALNALKRQENSPIQQFGDIMIQAPANGNITRADQWLLYPKMRQGEFRNRTPLTRDGMGDAMREAVRLKLYGENGKGAAIDNTVNWIFDNEASNLQTIQTFVDGEPVIHGSGLDQDGREFEFYLRGSEIIDAHDRRMKAKKKSSTIQGNIDAVVEGVGGAVSRAFSNMKEAFSK